MPGVPERPRQVYLAGIECWATDLLAVLRGELGPITLAYGRATFWNALPQGFRFDLFEALFRLSHPLRRPADFLRTYRRLWDENRSVPPQVAFARTGVANTAAPVTT